MIGDAIVAILPDAAVVHPTPVHPTPAKNPEPPAAAAVVPEQRSIHQLQDFANLYF